MDGNSPGDQDAARSPSPSFAVTSNHVSTLNSKGQPLTGTECAVCGEVGVNGVFFRRHYSVICCEACKCFFRRTVQMSRDYKCRFQGKCCVGRHKENLSQLCQACRFNKCIQSGMKIDSVKKFPRKPRIPKAGLEDSTEATPTSTLKRTPSKPKKQKKSKKGTLDDGFANGNSLDQFDLQDGLPHPASVLAASPGEGGVEQEEELALSDTDLANVKFKMSPSEAMLYLQSASTSVSQLFKYDSVDSLHEKTSLASPSTISTVKVEGGSNGGHSYLQVVSGHSPGSADGGSIKRKLVARKTGVNGCGHNKSKKRSFRGKRGPEESAKDLGGVEMLSEEEYDHAGRIEDVNLVAAAALPIATAVKRACTEIPSLVHPAGGKYHAQLTLPAGRGSVSSPPHTPISPTGASLLSPGSHPPSRVNTPEPPTSSLRNMGGSSMLPANNGGNRSTYNSPYVTPHGTPVHTPYQSPLPSPHTPTLQHQYHTPFPPGHQVNPPASHFSLPGAPVIGHSDMSSVRQDHLQTTSPPMVLNSLSLPGIGSGRGGVIQLHQKDNAHGTILLNPSHGGMPIHVIAPTATILPATMVLSAHPTHPPSSSSSSSSFQQSSMHQVGTGAGGGGAGDAVTGGQRSLPSKSPFRIIPIPSINRTLPEEVPNEPDSDKLCESPGVHGDLPGSSSSSACPSPVLSKPKTFSHLAEAQLEEVLHSLGLRIRSLFKWAKSDVSGFDDLSPMDQKALLRRTVPEMVMLGFAKGSVPFDNLLMLGNTGKVIRPTNQNNGVASVALVTLQKLVVPLKILNINDREFVLLKEIVLFNPESSGLRNREGVRVNRRQRHMKLLEYMEKSQADPSRFGELMCLLTPLFEVSTEVTEQLRLEQFVHEGEARIDALLLMSMINVADETMDPHL